jgi:hypothetical protein
MEMKMENRIKFKAGQSGEDGNNYLRSKRIEIRASPQEYAQLEHRAQQMGYHNLAQYLREAGLSRKDLVSPTTRQKQKNDWLYAVNRIGNNLNQIARQVNAGHDPDDEILLVLAQIQEMVNQVLKQVLKPDEAGDEWEGV